MAETTSQNNIDPIQPVKIEVDKAFGNTPNNNSTLRTTQTGTSNLYQALQDSQKPLQSAINGQLNQVSPTITTDDKKKSIIRTYRSDVESIINQGHLSSVNIAVAELEKRRNQVQQNFIEQNDKNSKKTTLIVLISVVIFIGGLAAIVIPMLNKNTNVPNNLVANLQPYGIISSESTAELDLQKITLDKFSWAILDKVTNSNITVNTILELYATTPTDAQSKRLITSQEFMKANKFTIPDQLYRNLLPGYFLGILSYNKNIPMLFIKTKTFDVAYSGMLNWEKSLLQDLKTIFNLNILNENVLNPGAVVDYSFKDIVIKNKDCRMVKNPDGETVLIYSILDNDTVIITTSEQGIKEAISRLNRSKETIK
jgi:hypothetical protein